MQQHEKLKLDDFKAHYAVVVGELSIVNQQLSDALDKKKKAEEDYSSLLEKISDAVKVHEGLLAQDEDILASQQSRSNSLDEKERKLAAEQMVFESYKVSEIDKIESKRTSVSTEVAQNEMTLSVIARDLALAESELTETATILSQKKDEKAQVEKELSILRQKQQDSIQEGEQQKKTLDASIAERESILGDLEKQIADEKAKIGGPLKLLADRDLAVAKRELDFEIMYQRLNVVFQKMYPDQKLVI